MTALERQLTRALRELSAQYEQEQRQHAEQIATLQRQVEHYAGQETRLMRGLQDARRDVARALAADAPARSAVADPRETMV